MGRRAAVTATLDLVGVSFAFGGTADARERERHPRIRNPHPIAYSSSITIYITHTGPDAFLPNITSVPRETAVTFANQTGDFHLWTTNGNSAQRVVPPRGSVTFTFKHAGTYGYHCAYHPEEVGTIIVGR